MSKLQNTNEWKARFFALYYGQIVGKAYSEDDTTSKVGGIYDIPHMVATGWHLSLRSISSLTDEEVIYMASTYNKEVVLDNNEIISEFNQSLIDLINSQTPIRPFLVDYIRSIGVFIPFMGEYNRIIEWGWVKIKE